MLLTLLVSVHNVYISHRITSQLTLIVQNKLSLIFMVSLHVIFNHVVGWTPLHEACNHGYNDIVVLLINSGAYVNASGMGGDTPLHDAVVNNHVEVCVYVELFSTRVI